jgi:hypothetical protein
VTDVEERGVPPVAARALEIGRRATVNLEERGLDRLHLVLGFATWRPDDEGRPPTAPFLLMPVRIEATGRDGSTGCAATSAISSSIP